MLQATLRLKLLLLVKEKASKRGFFSYKYALFILLINWFDPSLKDAFPIP